MSEHTPIRGGRTVRPPAAALALGAVLLLCTLATRAAAPPPSAAPSPRAMPAAPAAQPADANPAAAVATDARADVLAAERVVRDFNTAISARRLDAALALIAPGAVNFNLHAAHGGAPGDAPPPLTTDLGVHWRTVTPILFGQTRAFRRELRSLSTQVDGELASCWAQVETTTEPRAAGAPAVRRSFAESYLLRREGTQWRIVAMASARAAR